MAELDYDIAKIFENMELDLIRSMKRSLQSHKNQELKEGFDWEMWQAAKLRELKAYRKRNAAIIGKYTSTLPEDIEEILKQQYYEGADNTDAEVRAAVENGYITKSSPDFGKINDKKINSLIDAVNNDFSEAKKAIFRKSIDEYRKTIFTAEMNLAAGAKTLNQAIDMATKLFLAQGINCITYKDGRKVNISSYAQMALRTAHRRAFLTGEGERRKEWGECLVMTSQYMQCSETCLPWQGRVYVDDVYSGAGREDIEHYAAKGYKKLSTAIEGGLLHPNCKHILSTWFEGVSTMPTPHDPQEVRQKREQALKEQRCKQQIKKYKRLEAGSCDEDNIRKYDKKLKQWQEKLKEVKNNGYAPKDKPKAFKGLSAKISGKGIPEHDEPVLLKKIDINDNEAIARELKNFEDYAINEDIETACVITKDGDVYKCFGINDAVFPDFDLGERLKGAIVSHNHPIEETEYSFSNLDLQLFMDYNLKVLRGCDKKYIYEFTRNPNDIDHMPKISISEIDEEIYQHLKIIRKATENKIGYRRWKNDKR